MLTTTRLYSEMKKSFFDDAFLEGCVQAKRLLFGLLVANFGEKRRCKKPYAVTLNPDP